MIYLFEFSGVTELIPHTALMVTSGPKPIYVSYFPSNNPSIGFNLHDFSKDKKHNCARVVELPSQEEHGYGLSEKNIYEWWNEEFPRQLPTFDLLTYNCSNLVRDALLAGSKNQKGIYRKISEFHPWICTPKKLLNFALDLKEKINLYYKLDKPELYLNEFINLLNDETIRLENKLLNIFSYVIAIQKDSFLLSKASCQLLIETYQTNINNIMQNILALLNDKHNNLIDERNKGTFICELVDVLVAESDNNLINNINDIIKCDMVQLIKTSQAILGELAKIRITLAEQQEKHVIFNIGKNSTFWQNKTVVKFLENTDKKPSSPTEIRTYYCCSR